MRGRDGKAWRRLVGWWFEMQCVKDGGFHMRHESGKIENIDRPCKDASGRRVDVFEHLKI
jgi:hypothetical protein